MACRKWISGIPQCRVTCGHAAIVEGFHAVQAMDAAEEEYETRGHAGDKTLRRESTPAPTLKQWLIDNKGRGRQHANT